MSKNHLKREMVNKKWILLRKENKYVLRPNPGKHLLNESIPLAYFLKNSGFVKTLREAKKLLLMNDVFVDKKKVKDVKFSLGFMDIVSVGDKFFRCLFDDKGRVCFIDVDQKDSDKKICKILEKKKIKKGKIQLNLSDGRNILVEDDSFKTGDSLVLELPSQKIIKVLPFKEGVSIVIKGGKYVGKLGKVSRISNELIFFKDEEDGDFSTLKSYAFVVGGDVPEIKIK
jgi:small subunit ribosomal protein S4e